MYQFNKLWRMGENFLIEGKFHFSHAQNVTEKEQEKKISKMMSESNLSAAANEERKIFARKFLLVSFLYITKIERTMNIK
jgi:hypothetical protein